MDEDLSGNFATDEQLAAECSVCKVNVLLCSAMHRDARKQLHEDLRHIPTDVLRRAVRLRCQETTTYVLDEEEAKQQFIEQQVLGGMMVRCMECGSPMLMGTFHACYVTPTLR